MMQPKRYQLSAMLSLLLWPSLLIAQYNMPQNNFWAMGENAGLNFNTNPPSVFATHISSFECNAAVSTSNGNLVFYTNGNKVWNASNNLMPNGVAICPVNAMSSTQGALIVPTPGNNNRYYLFSLAKALYVNVVDRSLDNGAGDIDLSYPLRGVKLADSLNEKMIAIKGCNNNVWVLVHSYNAYKVKECFLAFEITASGLNPVPVISQVGHFPREQYFQGQMKISPDRKKLVAVSTAAPATESFDFDFLTGIVSNAKIIDTIPGYGCAFSPGGSKLYLHSNAGQILQYDLAAPVPATTKTVLLSNVPPTHLKLAADHKIYFISPHNVFGNTGNSYLGRINKPETAGVGCGLQDSVTALAYSNIPVPSLSIGLPNEVVVADNEETVLDNRLVMDTSVCHRSGSAGLIVYAASGFTGYTWDNQSTYYARNINSSGVYWVRYTTVCGPRTDTFKIGWETFPALGIGFSDATLSADHQYAHYQWYKNGIPLTGETDSTLSVTDTGWYSLKVYTASGCSDSASYHITAITGINENYGRQAGLVVYPNPVQHEVHVKTTVPVSLQLFDLSDRMLKQAKGNLIPVRDIKEGLYLLKIYDQKSGKLINVHKILKVKTG